MNFIDPIRNLTLSSQYLLNATDLLLSRSDAITVFTTTKVALAVFITVIGIVTICCLKNFRKITQLQPLKHDSQELIKKTKIRSKHDLTSTSTRAKKAKRRQSGMIITSTAKIAHQKQIQKSVETSHKKTAAKILFKRSLREAAHAYRK